MLILEFIDWVLDNPGDATIWTIAAFALRKIVLSEIARVIQMGRDEELIWTREKVEVLTGEKWNGPQPILKRARIQYTVKYYLYLLQVIGLVYLLRRMGRMQISKAWLVGLLGYVAYFLKQSTGYDVSDEMINSLSDMVLLAIALVPMFMNMRKKNTSPQTGNEPVSKPQEVEPDKFIQG